MEEQSTRPVYTTSLAKGQALVQETLDLLSAWEPGMAANELATLALERNVLSKHTEVRTRDIVTRIFGKRYLTEDGEPARRLKRLAERDAAMALLRQLMLLYTARFHRILHDYVRMVYWPRYQAGASHVTGEDTDAFMEEAVNDGRIRERWAASMRARVARYLYGCLVDFRMAAPASGRRREIIPFHPLPETVVYLAHDLRFQGMSENQIMGHVDWQLFGLEPTDVYRRLDLAAAEGHFLIQYSGELLRISWKYDDMETCIDAIA